LREATRPQAASKTVKSLKSQTEFSSWDSLVEHCTPAALPMTHWPPPRQWRSLNSEGSPWFFTAHKKITVAVSARFDPRPRADTNRWDMDGENPAVSSQGPVSNRELSHIRKWSSTLASIRNDQFSSAL
jgi:hypothetical protein